MKTKLFLDELVEKYETEEFIKDDPIQFPHRYKNEEDIEIAAFLASIFAYGKREVFIAKLNNLFEIMGNEPRKFLNYFDANNTKLNEFNYRFSTGIDLIQIISTLQELYNSHKSLKCLFEYGWNTKGNTKGMLEVVVDYFYSNISLPVTNGYYHLIPNPKKNSACKRLNMFLRWLVRGGEVDLGIWEFMPKSELLIPLDTHVAKISRQLKLLTRNQNDYKAVVELTNNLKKYDYNDPTKYDFAMFGYGINKYN